MDRFRRHLKKFACVALLAFVGLAVAPTVSRAIHQGNGAAMAAGDGGQHVAGMGAGAAHHHHGLEHGENLPSLPLQPAGHLHSLDHCALCWVAAWAFALDAAPTRLVIQGFVHERVAGPIIATPRYSDVWSPATSRGPPPGA